MIKRLVVPSMLCSALLVWAAGHATLGAEAPAPAASAGPWSIRMADSVMARCPKGTMIELKNPSATPAWTYSVAFNVRAIGEVGRATGRQKYLDYVKEYADAFLAADGTIDPKRYRPDEFKLDDIAPGRMLLMVYRDHKEEKYRKAIDTLAEQFKTQPRTSDGGFWHKKVYPHQMWLDGIFMDCPFMAEYGAMTNQAMWFDEVARQITLIARHTQDPKNGLCYHGWDESRQQKWADPQTGLSPHFWGRAVGWYAMGIVETLDDLPQNHPQRQELIAILRKLAGGIASVQDPASGLWYQVLDQGSREGNYLEASASCMFTYALAKGVRKGYLDASFMEVARKGYQGILQRLISVDPQNGQVHLKDTCQVAGLGGNPYRDGSFAYYVHEPRVVDDPKGVAPFILASLEMERLAAKP